MPLRRRIDRIVIYLRRHGLAATIREVAVRAKSRMRAGDRPTAIHIEVSNCCNLRCEYCVLDQNAPGDKLMSDATFDALLPYLADARRIDLSGLAEPLMNRRFLSMLRKARGAAPNAHIAMCTNATLLTEEISEQVVELGLDELTFSLDGVDPQQVDAIRRGGSLDRVVANIAALSAVKRRLGSERPHVSATVVLQRDNVAQLPAIVELAAEIGCEAVSVNGLEPYSEGLVDKAIWPDPSAAPELREALLDAEQVAERRGLQLRLPALSPQAPMCPQAGRPLIMADGTVVPCSVLAYERDSVLGVSGTAVVRAPRKVGRRSFGRVATTDDLAAIWSNPEYRQFRRDAATGKFPPECELCLMKHGVVCPTPPLGARESLKTVDRPGTGS